MQSTHRGAEDEVSTLERGLKRMERGELQGKTAAWDENTERFFKYKYGGESARSGASGGTSNRNLKKNDSSSMIESDQSIVLITKKIQELKNEQKRLTQKSKERKDREKKEDVTFRKRP